MNFKDLLKDHPELDESGSAASSMRTRFARPTTCTIHWLICAAVRRNVGEDDVKLFKYHVMCGENRRGGQRKQNRWKGTIIEIPVNSDINFEWSHSNLERGPTNGAIAAEQAYKLYKAREKDPNKPLVVGAVSENSECSK